MCPLAEFGGCPLTAISTLKRGALDARRYKNCWRPNRLSDRGSLRGARVRLLVLLGEQLLEGELAGAEPNSMRYCLLHTAGVVVR
jgi:hypothetical protein